MKFLSQIFSDKPRKIAKINRKKRFDKIQNTIISKNYTQLIDDNIIEKVAYIEKLIAGF